MLFSPSIKSLPDSACLCFFSGTFRELFLGLVQFIVVTDGWIGLGSFPAVLEAELLDQTEITVV